MWVDWSPDSTKLAYLTLTEAPGVLRWSVLNVADGSRWPLVDFLPSADHLTMLQFFDQYAQAWRPWTPDSSAFAFVGSINGLQGVWVRDLDAAEPRFLIEGDWVAWSAG